MVWRMPTETRVPPYLTRRKKAAILGQMALQTGHDAKIRLTCPKCDKTYRIRKHKIPPGSTAVRCKVCGKRVRLKFDSISTPVDSCAPKTVSSADAGVKMPVLAAPRCRLDLMTEEKRLRARRKHRTRKPWPF